LRGGSLERCIVAGVFVQPQNIASPLEQIGRNFTGLVVNPSHGIIDAHFLTRSLDAHTTDAVGNSLGAAEAAFGQNYEKIVFSQTHAKITSAAGLAQTVCEFGDKLVTGILAEALCDFSQVVEMQRHYTQW